MLPSLRKRFINLTKSTPEQVAMIKESAPSIKIFTESSVRKCVA